MNHLFVDMMRIGPAPTFARETSVALTTALLLGILVVFALESDSTPLLVAAGVIAAYQAARLVLARRREARESLEDY